MARRILWCLVGVMALSAPGARADGAPAVGVLVVAHGGTNQWDGTVRKTVRDAGLAPPVEVVFGMGMHPEEVRAFQDAVNRLQRKEVGRIIVVPLLVSSHSEVFRQYEYLFGLRDEPEWPEAGKPLHLEVPVVMGQALDDDPALAEVLTERAGQLSRKPEDETVFLIAHGPVEDEDDQRWLERLSQLGAQIQAKAGFHGVRAFTMRDDAPDAVKERAEQNLRAALRDESRQRRVLVVPVLIARGGVERKIPKILAGLSYVYKGRTLLPHKKMEAWLARQAARLASSGSPEPVLK
jgi:sirohydrochlorin ferrochelatase